MAVTLDTTVGGASTNSYTTRAEASSYFAKNPNIGATWLALTSAAQDTALAYSTQILDYWVDWIGTKATDTQARRWPRYGAEDRDGYWIDGDVHPTFLKEATAELAYHLQASDLTAEPDTKGFKELGVGSLKLVVDKADRDGTTLIPDVVKAMIESYGTIRARGGSASVQLLRA